MCGDCVVVGNEVPIVFFHILFPKFTWMNFLMNFRLLMNFCLHDEGFDSGCCAFQVSLSIKVATFNIILISK